MSKKTQPGKPRERIAMPPPSPGAQPGEQKVTAFAQMQQLGYPRYTFAKEFEAMDLNTDPRAYPVAKRVDVLTIKEDDGTAPYVGLGFIGPADEQLFLIVMDRTEAIDSATRIKTAMPAYVGIDFSGVTKRFGSVGTIAMPREAYARFVEALGK